MCLHANSLLHVHVMFYICHNGFYVNICLCVFLQKVNNN